MQTGTFFLARAKNFCCDFFNRPCSFSAEHSNDQEVMLAVAARDPYCIKYASDELLESPSFFEVTLNEAAAEGAVEAISFALMESETARGTLRNHPALFKQLLQKGTALVCVGMLAFVASKMTTFDWDRGLAFLWLTQLGYFPSLGHDRFSAMDECIYCDYEFMTEAIASTIQLSTLFRVSSPFLSWNFDMMLIAIASSSDFLAAFDVFFYDKVGDTRDFTSLAQRKLKDHNRLYTWLLVQRELVGLGSETAQTLNKQIADFLDVPYGKVPSKIRIALTALCKVGY